MRSTDVIREARLRAGLSQYELADRSGLKRGVIARWEQGTVAPSVETLIELVRACGFGLPLELVPYEPGGAERLQKTSRPFGVTPGWSSAIAPAPSVLRIVSRATRRLRSRAPTRDYHADRAWHYGAAASGPSF